MAAFASDRRSGWVRVLVLILCALFIFATVATPPAYAVGETVALFGLAAVLSAATAAMGFKLANNAEGQATLQKMVQDFAGASIAAGLVLTGSKVNGLINGMQYIKMAVHNGKTYLDERIFAWVQQWLAKNGVYDAGTFVPTDYSSYPNGTVIDFGNLSLSNCVSVFPASLQAGFLSLISHYGLASNNHLVTLQYYNNAYNIYYSDFEWSDYKANNGATISIKHYSDYVQGSLDFNSAFLIIGTRYQFSNGSYSIDSGYSMQRSYLSLYHFYNGANEGYTFSNVGSGVSSANTTGLSGTDTLGKDVIDLTLDQILEKLKEWAQDWFDAGADSVTNAATGAKDLPLSVATGAATLNPDVAEDGPLVYFPAFGWSLPKLRSGETDTKTVDQGKENASSAETSVDVAENQTVIDSLVNWALGYISPDTGLFSKFPLCVPYDAYLLACSALGVGVVGSDSIFGASPDDLSSIVQTGDEQSEGFTPVITISNDLTLDGYTYPIDLTIDLTDWTPLIKFVRLAISITVIAELIGAEYKRIKGK